jgi:hypothetical protein
MFPGNAAIVYTNEAGEILGWDYESYEPDECFDPYYDDDRDVYDGDT